MHPLTTLAPLLAFGAMTFCSCWSLAQAPAEPSVTANGTAVIKKTPEFLRLQVDLLARGKDLKEALANMEVRRKAAQSQLLTMGADKNTIEIGDSTITTGKSARQQQMEMMVQQRRRQQGKKPAKEEKPPVMIAVTCKADFPISALSQGELLIAAQNLQDKIKAADLSGAKELEKQSPKDEEVAEENQEMAFGPYDGVNEIKPGEPVFVYVSKISDEERNKALADAFQKAKQEAGALAKAAGVELGNLQHLSNSFQWNDPSNMMEQMNNPYYYQAAQRLQYANTESDGQPREAVGPQPTKVTLRVNVNAAFRLQSSGK